MSEKIDLSNLSGLKAITKLNRTNYSTWKIQVSAALKSRGLWNITTGEDVRPDAEVENPSSDLDQKAWDQADASAQLVLSLTASKEQLRYVICDRTTSKEMWDTWSLFHDGPGNKGIANQPRWEDEVISDEEDDFRENAASFVCENNRVIIFLDVDCFEVQLWLRELRPDLIGQDVPVVVINSGRIILSVNYTARSMGVKRGEGSRSLKEAHILCKNAGADLVEIIVPELYGKANNFLPMVEQNLILKAISSFPKFKNQLSSIKIERNSGDELYIDVTHLIQEKFISSKITTLSGNPICVPSQREINSLIQRKHHPNDKYDGKAETVLEGKQGVITGEDLRSRILQTYHPQNIEADHLDELRLVYGAIMAIEIIRHIQTETGYEVSAGVSHFKLLAKLACDLNKPKGITIIPQISLKRLSKIIAFQELPGFGGKTGEAIRKCFLEQGQTVESVSDVLRATNRDLNYCIDMFEQQGIPNAETTAKDLFSKCQFEDDSEVTLNVKRDKISTALKFKRCKDLDLFQQFEQLKKNIAQDMASKINYYKKELGKIATEITVKIKTSGLNMSQCTLGPRNLISKMTFPQETDHLVSHDSIYQFVSEYIINMGFNWDKVSEICLTTQNFLTDKNEANKNSHSVYSTA